MSEWPIQPLGELAIVTMGQSPDAAAVNGEEVGLPFLQGCAEFGERFPAPRLHCSPPLRVAKEGSTLISVRAPVGTTNRADQDYCIGRGLGAVLAKPGVADDVFLLHAIEANLEFLHRRSQGSTFLAIGSKDLFSLPAPAPELATQRRIAEILTTLDETIEQTEALIAKMQQVKAGLMHDLFTRGVTPDGQLRPTRDQVPDLYKESPLGWIPKEWEVCSWGQVTASWAMGPRFSAEEYSENGNVATMRTTDMNNDGIVTYSTMPRAKLDLTGLTQHLLQPNDFVISRSGTCGIGAVFESFDLPVLPGAFLIRFRFLEKMSPFFMRYYVNSGVGAAAVARIAEGGVQKNIRGTGLCRLLLPVPSIDEQTSMVAHLSTIDRLADHEAAKLAKLRKQKHGLMYDLLTGRVRVKDAKSKVNSP
jgi:type I restriction enzyme, S subunit